MTVGQNIMDVSGQINEELLICKVCYGRFSTTDRLPKLLACSHTFCSECIVQYLRKRKKSKVKFPCPLCRKETNLGKEGVAGLGNNFTVMGLMEILDMKAKEGEYDTWKLPTSPTSPSRQRPGLPGGWANPAGPTPSSQPPCDNCDNAHADNMAVNVLNCGHVYCDVCIRKCGEDGEDCLQCSMVGVGARRRTPHHDQQRPPAYNPTYPTSPLPSHHHHHRHAANSHHHSPPLELEDYEPISSPQPPVSAVSSASRHQRQPMSAQENLSIYGRASTIRHVKKKPPVPQRTSPVKPLVQGGTLGRRAKSPGRGLPPVNEVENNGSRQKSKASPPLPPPNSMGPGGGSYTLRSPRSSQPRPHTMHISSTLPRHTTFASPIHRQVVLPAAEDEVVDHDEHHHHDLHHSQSAQTLSSPHPAGRMHQSHSHGHLPSTTVRTGMPPQPPTRRLSDDTSLASPLRCLGKFGRYSTVRLQTNAFHQPSHLTVSDFTNQWAVVDSVNMTLQIFDFQGSYQSMFKVLGIRCACFISSDKLAVGTHRGVELCRPDGASLRELPIGSVTAVVPYKHGFIACLTNKIQLYSPSLTMYRELHKRKTGKLRRGTAFQHIAAAAVNSQREIVILDTGLGDISVLDEDGVVKLVIEPGREACGRLRAPEALAVDRLNNILVADTGNHRLLRFSNNGMFSRALLNYTLPTSAPVGGANTPGQATVHGVAVGKGDRMGVVVTGREMAQVRVYQLV